VNPDANERILAWRPDAVVVHGYVHATARRAILGLSRAGVPVLLRGESNLLAPRPPWVALAKQLWLRYLFRHVAGFLAIGKLSREYYLHYGIEERRVHLAPYSVDNEFFSRAPLERRVKALEWRGRLGIDPEEKVILYAAKFIPAKACHDLVEAFSAVASRARLVLVGSGPLEAELKALAQRVAPGRAHFLGFVNQSAMPSAYEMGDIFVLPSVREPWGLAVNEAMCVGKPIVATDQVGSVPDLVSQENGWVYPAGDRRRLAAILDEALGPDGGLEERGCVSARRIASWGIRETADGFLTAAGSVARQAM
jgi:glycosyltransferase involved in cell wall biosynthesis